MNNQLKKLHFFLVEKYFDRHTLQGRPTVSNKRHECNSLLQGSALYMSRTADFSAIYSELSHLFFNGCVDIQLVNFLHLINIMAETGSTVEKTESFIRNAQRIPKLLVEEVTWFCEHGNVIDNTPIFHTKSAGASDLVINASSASSIAECDMDMERVKFDVENVKGRKRTWKWLSFVKGKIQKLFLFKISFYLNVESQS